MPSTPLPSPLYCYAACRRQYIWRGWHRRMSRGGGSRPGPPASCAACRTGTSTPLPCAPALTHATLLPGMPTSDPPGYALAPTSFTDYELRPNSVAYLAPRPALPCPTLLYPILPWPIPPGFTVLIEVLTGVIGILTYASRMQQPLPQNANPKSSTAEIQGRDSR